MIVAEGHVNARTVQSIVYGKLSNSGQTCVTPDYALIHENDLEALIHKYDATIRSFYPDGPTTKDTLLL